MGYRENITFAILFVSCFLLFLASFKPDYSIVLATMIFSFISILLLFLPPWFLPSSEYSVYVTPNEYSNDFEWYNKLTSKINNTWIGYQFICSLAAFCICFQAFCCGTHGFTEIPWDTINSMDVPRDIGNNMETPRDPVNNMVTPSSEIPCDTINNRDTIVDIVNNIVTPWNTVNMVNLRRNPTASEVTASLYATQADETNQSNETSEKEVGSGMETSLVVNLLNDDIYADTEGLPTYQQAITNKD